MKKRIFTLLAVLVLCFALFSCGKDEADHVVDAFVGVGDVYSESDIAKIFDTDTKALRVSVSVDSLEGVKDITDNFDDDLQLPEIEKAKVDLYFDLENAKLAQVISAVCDGEKVDLTAVEDMETLTVKSSLFDEVYGVETEEMLEWLHADDALSTLENMLPALADFIEKTDEIGDKYEKVLKDVIRDSLDIDKEKDGKYTVLSFEIGVKEMDDILDGLAEAIEDDEDLEELFDAFDADLGDLADMMSSALDDAEGDEEIEFELTVLGSKSKLIAMEIVAGEATTVEYEGDEKTDDFVCEITDGENVTKISFEDGNYEIYTKDAYTYEDGDYYLYENTVSATFEKGEVTFEVENLSENKWGDDVNREENKASATFGYKSSADKLTLTLKGIGYNGVNVKNIDEKVGLTVEIEKNPTLPKGEKKFEEIDDVQDFNEEVVGPVTELLRELFTFREEVSVEARAED